MTSARPTGRYRQLILFFQAYHYFKNVPILYWYSINRPLDSRVYFSKFLSRIKFRTIDISKSHQSIMFWRFQMQIVLPRFNVAWSRIVFPKFTSGFSIVVFNSQSTSVNNLYYLKSFKIQSLRFDAEADQIQYQPVH